jgi:hypothetical protein
MSPFLCVLKDAFAQEMKNIRNLLFIINPGLFLYPCLQQKKVEKITPICPVPAIAYLWHLPVCICQHPDFNMMDITPSAAQLCLLTVKYE